MLELGMSFDIAAPLLTQIAIALAKKDLAIALAKKDPSAQEVEAGGWFEWIKEKYPPRGNSKAEYERRWVGVGHQHAGASSSKDGDRFEGSSPSPGEHELGC